MATPHPQSLTEEALEAFFGADYAAKDTMHDLTHVRRVHRAAVRLAAVAGQVCDRQVLLVGAYLHGIVYLPDRERLARRLLQDAGMPEALIERAVQAAQESQTDAEPRTPEGIVLHDGHLLEGGRAFLLAKTLVTGAARGSTLSEIIAYWDQHVRGRYRCALPVAQARYEEQQAFAQAAFDELTRDAGLDAGSPAA